MKDKFKNCQSCGMPLSKSPNGGGTEVDGSVSTMYCAHCYDKGSFKQPDLSLSEMQDLVKAKMKEIGFPGFLAGMFTKRISKLKRWSS